MLTEKLQLTKKLNDIYKPDFFRLSNAGEKKAFEDLLASKPHIMAHDTMWAQLKELVKSLDPAHTFTMDEIEAGIKKHLGTMPMEEYGVWVYYPWSERVVHILDEDEFKELRTNRNRYKITREEQDALNHKKIGVIGLSVGQSVSLTLAMERGFGELRIADFDDLEITNLNRLRSGVHNMGLLKTVLVAREIAEIDPYLKVTPFHEGITEENIEHFLLDGGKLDVLIDECDGVEVKIKCRIAAKKHGIPVLMEASDRGTIDIERFDLEPDRPILHGKVEHLDLSRVKEAKTMEDKLPYLLPIVGIETMSTRLKASAIEIGQTINTWPQLASAVTLGGGITADICRRVLLDQLHVSGRWFIDIEDLIGDPKTKQPEYDYNIPQVTADSIRKKAALAPHTEVPGAITDVATIDQLIAAAAIAPSAGNNQPWRLYFDGRRIVLLDDPVRSAAFANYRNMKTFFSMGSLIENVDLKARELGLGLDVRLFPLKEQGIYDPVAVLVPYKKDNVQKDELVNYLYTRHTNRKWGTPSAPIPAAAMEEMKQAIAPVKNIQMIVTEDPQVIQKMADIAGKAEKLRMFIPQGHADLFRREIRWDAESAIKTRDGLDIRTLDLTAKDEVGFRVIQDMKAINMVSGWHKGTALEDMSRNLVASSSAVCIFTVPEFTPENCVAVGHALERLWLAAEKHKIALQPMMAAILHFTRLNHGGAGDMPADIQKQFMGLQKEFIQLFNLSSTTQEPLFLFRLCIADEPEVRSLRLNIDEIYISDTNNKG